LENRHLQDQDLSNQALKRADLENLGLGGPNTGVPCHV
jgi:hypothetical protein